MVHGKQMTGRNYNEEMDQNAESTECENPDNI